MTSTSKIGQPRTQEEEQAHQARVDQVRAVVKEMGFLTHEVNLYQAHGVPTPPQTARRMQEMEAFIATNYAGHEASIHHQALKEAQQFRAEYNEMQTQRQTDGFVREMEQVSQDLTRDFTSGPLNSEQRKAVSRGEKIKLSNNKKTSQAETWDQVAAQYGMKDHKELHAALDDLRDAQLSNPDRFEEKLAKEYPGLSATDVEIWAEKGAGLAFGLHERMASREEDMAEAEEFTPPEQDVRKAALQDSWMEKEREALPHDDYEPLPRELLEDEHRAGDVARAMMQVEAGQGVLAHDDVK